MQPRFLFSDPSASLVLVLFQGAYFAKSGAGGAGSGYDDLKNRSVAAGAGDDEVSAFR